MSYDSARYALLNRWDPRHLRTVQQTLHPAPGTSLLEVGCGRGHLLRRLQDMGVDAHGVDVNPEAIAHGLARNMRVMRAEELAFGDDTFDQLCSFHAIEHVPELERALSEMRRVVRPGGLVLAVYPAEPVQGLYAVPTSIILHGTPFQARQIHCHRLTPKRLRRLTDPLGLVHLRSEFNLLSSPQFVSLFRAT